MFYITSCRTLSLEQGVNRKDAEAMSKILRLLGKAMTDGNLDAFSSEDVKELHEITGRRIKTQKERLGGNFAVARAIRTKHERDVIRHDFFGLLDNSNSF